MCVRACGGGGGGAARPFTRSLQHTARGAFGSSLRAQALFLLMQAGVAGGGVTV